MTRAHDQLQLVTHVGRVKLDIGGNTGGITWRDAEVYIARPAPEHAAVLVRYEESAFSDDAHVEVVDAPQRILVSDEILAIASPMWLAEGDGIITLAPDHESRVSYRRAEFDVELNMWWLERIS